MNSTHKLEVIITNRCTWWCIYLTGKHHFEGINMMEQLLKSEGVEVKDNQIQNFKTVFWDPSKEL